MVFWATDEPLSLLPFVLTASCVHMQKHRVNGRVPGLSVAGTHEAPRA